MIGGIASATVLAVLIVPVFFVLVVRMTGHRRLIPEPPPNAAMPLPEESYMRHPSWGRRR